MSRSAGIKCPIVNSEEKKMLSQFDVEMGPMLCKKCGEELVSAEDGEYACPHCQAKKGVCDGCGKTVPTYGGKCVGCRHDMRKQAESKARWGQKRGACLEFCGRNIKCVFMAVASLSLLVIAGACVVPLIIEVEQDISQLIRDVHGGVAPMLDEGGRVIGYGGRNIVSAMRILETPLNFTETVLEDADVIVKRVFDAISNPTAAFMAFSRVTGTMIICDDGTEYTWKPFVMRDGVVSNPYAGCSLHQTKLNDESHARFFPGKAPQRGDLIRDEHTLERRRVPVRGDHGPPRAMALRDKRDSPGDVPAAIPSH